MPDLSAPVLRGFVKDSIAPASTVHTDGWPSYQGLAKLGFRHTVTNLSTSGDPGLAACCSTACLSRLFSVLPRQLRPFTSAPDVGNGPQSPGNHYILGSVDLREHPLRSISHWQYTNYGRGPPG